MVFGPTRGNTTQHKKLRAYIRASDDIQIRNPSVREVQDLTRVSLHGHCDQLRINTAFNQGH
jgi:hypothetical protein